jgi:hypothetical protein
MLPRWKEVQTCGRRNTTKGLTSGGPAHVLDAAEIISECWDELESKTIAACWTRARCLPMCDLADLASRE